MTRWMWLALLLCVACAKDADDLQPCEGRRCSSSCEALATGPCDILDEACRARVLDALHCVRGTPGVMPPVRTLTPEQLRAELEAQLDAELDAGTDDDDPDERDPFEVALQLVELADDESSLQEASVDDQVDTLAGYYNSTERAITLIDRGEPQDSPSSLMLLAHELVHALQDQGLGLRELSDRVGVSTDSRMARSCLTEGDATLYAELAFSLLYDESFSPGPWDARLARRLKYARQAVIRSRSPQTVAWHFAYPVGTRYLFDAWLAGGNDAVQALYQAPPLSTIHWMHGYEASMQASGSLVLPLACIEAAAPRENYEAVRETSMGPLMVFAFLGHALRDDGVFEPEPQWAHALQWRQDSFTVFESASGDVAVSWRMRFADPSLASSLADRIASAEPRGWRTFARDAELELLASEDLDVLADWQGTEVDACGF